MASQAGEMRLTSLPPELILHILNFTDPPSQFSLACASRRLAACCDRQLRRHQAVHARYGVSSDLDPATVPHLLRSALGHADPIDAWHVRSFELWARARVVAEWRPFDLEAKSDSGLKRGGEPLRWEFRKGEVEGLLGVFGEEMGDGVRAFAEEGLRAGADWFLKAVMLALLPRLVDVKVVAWLAHVMRWSSEHTPPMFASVRSVAVGVASGTWRDSLRGPMYAQPLASILHLPQLESLYFSDLEVGEEDFVEQDIAYADGHALLMGGHSFAGPYDYLSDYLPDPESAPLRRLTLDRVGDVEGDFRDALLATPRALEALSLRADWTLYDTDAWGEEAGNLQAGSLRRLMLYNPDDMRGYPCSAWRPDLLARCVPDLRQTCVAVSDVEMQGMDKGFAAMLRAAFPRGVEAMVLFGLTGLHAKGQEFPTQFLDDELAGVIRDKASLYPELRAVFLELVEEMTFRKKPGERACFPGVMEAGREMGVEVFTRTSGRGRARWGPEFLAPLGRYDLRTAPHWREGREGMVLDFGTGEWVEDCGCCGRCESCLKVYTAEVWDAVRRERGTG